MEILSRFQPILEHKHDYYVFADGRGTGKSYGLAQILILLGASDARQFGFAKPFLKILCTREIQDSIKQSVYAELVNIINEYGITGYRITEESIRHANGTEFIFKGLSSLNEQSIKSYAQVDICWVEEANAISHRSLSLLLPTIRKEGSINIFSFNPDKEDDAVYELFMGDKPMITDKVYISRSVYYENPYLSEKTRRHAAMLKANKPDEYAHVYLGELNTNKSTLVNKYFSTDNISDKVVYDKSLPLYLITDFNVDPNCWLVGQIVENKDSHDIEAADYKVYNIIDEICVDNSTTFDNCAEFIRRYGNHARDIIVIGDASGDARSTNSQMSNYVIIKKALFEHLKRIPMMRQFPFNPSISDSMNSVLNKTMGTDGIRRLFVNPKCEKTIQSFRRLSYKPETQIIDKKIETIKDSNNPLKYVSHIADCYRYFIHRFSPIRIYRKEEPKVNRRREDFFKED